MRNPGDPANTPLDATGPSRDRDDTFAANAPQQRSIGEAGALGQTEQVHSVTPEAKWGVTSGSPSGGIAGGTPAQQVAEIMDEE